MFNEFYYLKDGVNPNGDFVFEEGGAMTFKSNSGHWKLLDGKILHIQLGKNEFKY